MNFQSTRERGRWALLTARSVRCSAGVGGMYAGTPNRHADAVHTWLFSPSRDGRDIEFVYAAGLAIAEASKRSRGTHRPGAPGPIDALVEPAQSEVPNSPLRSSCFKSAAQASPPSSTLRGGVGGGGAFCCGCSVGNPVSAAIALKRQSFGCEGPARQRILAAEPGR